MITFQTVREQSHGFSHPDRAVSFLPEVQALKNQVYEPVTGNLFPIASIQMKCYTSIFHIRCLIQSSDFMDSFLRLHEFHFQTS